MQGFIRSVTASFAITASYALNCPDSGSSSPSSSYTGPRFGSIIITSSYTIDPQNITTVFVSDTSYNITLPDSSTFQDGIEYVIKDITGDADRHNITIQCSAPDFFENSVDKIFITDRYGYIKFISNISGTFYLTT